MDIAFDREYQVYRLREEQENRTMNRAYYQDVVVFKQGPVHNHESRHETRDLQLVNTQPVHQQNAANSSDQSHMK